MEHALRDLGNAVAEYEREYGPVPLPPWSPEQRLDPRLAKIVEAASRLRLAEAERDACKVRSLAEQEEQDSSADTRQG